MRLGDQKNNRKEGSRPLYLKGINPKKNFGQNFMVDQGILAAMVKAAKISDGEVVIEVGPGTGNLTVELLKKASFVVAVEKDRDMCQVLKETISLEHQDRLVIIEKDIRDITISEIFASYPKANILIPPYKVVANLPYYVSNPVIRFFLENEKKPKAIIVMVQKEVGERIIALPPKMTLLSASIQFYGKPQIIRVVPKGAFWPQPKVDSAILEIIPHSSNADTDPKIFFNLVRAGFRQPRKQLLNNLLALIQTYPLLFKEQIALLLTENSINPSQRAETLTVNDWVKITKSLIKILPK